ncbi:MAG: deiodinase-like protein [Gammaproteobacteria bacterium]
MAEKKQKMVYLAPRFRVKEYDWGVFVGPAAGEKAPDFTVTDQDGNEVKLSDYLGRWVVLETGSVTCSMYAKNIPGMKVLRKEFPDVEFLLIYVREAHPGERTGQHKSFEEKLAASKRLPGRYHEDRKILIDTLNGDMHRAYGVMPNVVYVIRPDGIVHYRCNWATVDGVREALSDREHLHTYENADMNKLKASRGFFTILKTMWAGGFLAFWDFLIATPALIRRHKMVDAYYAKHGRFQNQPSK